MPVDEHVSETSGTRISPGGVRLGNNGLYAYRDYNPGESVYSLLQKYQKVMKGFPR